MGSLSRVISPPFATASLRWLRRSPLFVSLLISPAIAQNGASTAPAPSHKPAQHAQPAKPKPEPPDTLQQHYDAARTFGISGDQEHAGIEYKAFLGEALRRTANARAKEGKPGEAIDLFSDAVAIAPDNPEVRLDFAVLYLDRQNFDAAKQQAGEAARLAPDNTRAQYILGRAFYGLDDFAGAKPHLEAAVAAKPNFEMGYALALDYLELKDLNRARLLFDEMITGLGDSAPLHIYFGHAYWLTSNFEKAIAEYKLALAKNPKVPQAHFFLGIAYLSRDEDKGWDEAAQEQREEIKNSPNDFRPHYELGNIALKQHRADEAERELKRASELDPDNPDPLISLGEIYAGQNRPQEAEAAMRKAIALTSDVSRAGYQINRAHYVLGRVLVQTGHREEGAKELKISAELRERTHPEVRNGANDTEISRSAQQTEVHVDEKGPTAKDSGANDSGAKDQFSAADQQRLDAYLDQLKPGIADAYNNLGVAAASRKDFAAALEDFRKASKWDPALATLDRNLGMAAFYAGQYDQAIPPLYRQLQQKPDDVRVRAALALSYFSTEKYAPTLETLNPVKDQVGDDPGLALAYAVSLVKTNQYDEGMARLKALEQSSPDSAGVHVAIGEAFADQKIYGTAVDEFRKALAVDPGQSRTHFLLGLALMHQETQAEAAQEFRAALKLDPANAEIKYHLAYSLIQVQQKQEAQALLDEVVKQDPNYADAFYQLGKLQLEQGDAKAAIANLETGTRLSPNSEYIHYQLSLAYRRDSRADDAAHEMQLYEAMKQRRRGDHESQSPN
jgi:tetratricopeptide (TPR) repeat protein